MTADNPWTQSAWLPQNRNHSHPSPVTVSYGQVFTLHGDPRMLGPLLVSQKGGLLHQKQQSSLVKNPFNAVKCRSFVSKSGAEVWVYSQSSPLILHLMLPGPSQNGVLFPVLMKTQDEGSWAPSCYRPRSSVAVCTVQLWGIRYAPWLLSGTLR